MPPKQVVENDGNQPSLSLKWAMPDEIIRGWRPDFASPSIL
jgi:hypothetical protein